MKRRDAGRRTVSIGFTGEVVAKRLGLLRELVPAAVRVAVLANPANVAVTSSTLTAVEMAAHSLGMEVQIYNASTWQEIDAAFAVLVRERPSSSHRTHSSKPGASS